MFISSVILAWLVLFCNLQLNSDLPSVPFRQSRFELGNLLGYGPAIKVEKPTVLSRESQYHEFVANELITKLSLLWTFYEGILGSFCALLTYSVVQLLH